MLDIALATKNRNELFKKALENINEQEGAEWFHLYILDGNETRGLENFIKEREWRFDSIEYYFEKDIEKEFKGSWSKMYNFLFEKGKSKYLTYWSDDITLDDNKSLIKSIFRLEISKKDCAAGVFPFISPTHDTKPYLMVTEIGTILINFGIVKREVFEKVGKLDERFIFFCADQDLTNKIYKEGYKIIINNDFKVRHVHFKEEWRSPLSSEKNTVFSRELIKNKWEEYCIPKLTLREDFIFSIYTKEGIFKPEFIRGKEIKHMDKYYSKIYLD